MIPENNNGRHLKGMAYLVDESSSLFARRLVSEVSCHSWSGKHHGATTVDYVGNIEADVEFADLILSNCNLHMRRTILHSTRSMDDRGKLC